MFGQNAPRTSEPPAAAGWYGKLPATGDFVTRRLPPDFVSSWDHFLGSAVAGSKELLGEAWLGHYLASPIWQFLVFPPLCGQGLWAGLMMPSVDRVGRYFPLTVCSRLAAVPDTAVRAEALLDWLDGLEGAALGALDPAARIEDFEEALQRHARPEPTPGEAGQARSADEDVLMPGLFMLHEGEVGRWLAQACADPEPLLGHSLWWSFAVDGDRVPAALVSGLPSAQSYARMIGGTF